MDMVTSNPDYYTWTTWEEMIKRDAAKNYNNHEQEFNTEKQKSIDSIIPGWKGKNIQLLQDNNKSLILEVDRLEKKLEIAMNS